MSDRDEATGQFESAEPAYGREGLEREAGFVPMVQEGEDVPEELTVGEAMDKIAELNSTPDSDIRTHVAGADLPENMSLTLEQAAKISADGHGADAAQAELEETAELQKEVDKLRGVDPDAKAPVAEPLTPEAEVEKFLAIPHVKEAVDKLTGEAETARQNHVAAVDAATEMVRATVLGRFPVMAQIANLPQEQQGHAVAAWMQQNPEGAAELAQSIGGLQQLVQQQQTHQRANAERARTEFQHYARAQDVQFSELMKGENMLAIEAEIPVMLKTLGVDPMEFLKAGNESKFLRSAPAQAILAKAAKYDLLMKTSKSVAARSLPPVQRPGVAQSRSRDSDSIHSLESIFANSTGEKQLRAGAALMAARSRRG